MRPDAPLTAERGTKPCTNEPDPRWPAGPLAVYRAFKTGKLACRAATRALIECRFLVRGPCALADETCKGRIEAHHEDYTNPWDVRWLCVRHHRWVDRGKTVGKRVLLTAEQKRERHRLRIAAYRARKRAEAESASPLRKYGFDAHPSRGGVSRDS